MKTDEEIIFDAIQARMNIAEWYNGRPYVGLDVTDVDKLVMGFDILGRMVYGKDVTMIGEKNESIEVRR